MSNEQNPKGDNVALSAGLDAALAEHVREHKASGSFHLSGNLGLVKMPRGYAIMQLDSGHYYGLKHDGTDTDITVRKWSVYRWARNDAKASNDRVQGEPALAGVAPGTHSCSAKRGAES